MTVCIATMCRYNFRKDGEDKDNWGRVILTASDRMLTDDGLGIQYETGQGKWAVVAKRVAALASGNITIHSDILSNIRKDQSYSEELSPKEIADIYAKYINMRRMEEAEKLYLSPFGLTMDSFLARQKEMQNQVVNTLSENIHSHSISVDALVVGCDEDGGAFIYSIDKDGIISCHSDIGFAAIGVGAAHSIPFLMSHSYWNGWGYYPALLATYSAKKSAEIAPGVGKDTDMSFISKDGIFHLYEGQKQALDKVYPKYVKQVKAAEKRALDDLMKHEKAFVEKQQKDTP